MRKPPEYRRELKDRILECASELFIRNGVRSVKMDDIAKHLSISKRTLYELYGNKEDLLCAVIVRRQDKERAEYEELDRTADNVMDILIGLIRLRLRQIADMVNPMLFSELSTYPRVTALLKKQREQRRQSSIHFLERGVEEGFFLPDVNYTTVSRISEGVIHGVLVSGHADIDLREFFHIAVLLFLRSICTKKGLMILDPFLKEMKGEATL